MENVSLNTPCVASFQPPLSLIQTCSWSFKSISNIDRIQALHRSLSGFKSWWRPLFHRFHKTFFHRAMVYGGTIMFHSFNVDAQKAQWILGKQQKKVHTIALWFLPGVARTRLFFLMRLINYWYRKRNPMHIVTSSHLQKHTVLKGFNSLVEIQHLTNYMVVIII